MFTDLREREKGDNRQREREGKRNIDVREETLIGCLLYTPRSRVEPATSVCALTRY